MLAMILSSMPRAQRIDELLRIEGYADFMLHAIHIYKLS